MAGSWGVACALLAIAGWLGLSACGSSDGDAAAPSEAPASGAEGPAETAAPSPGMSAAPGASGVPSASASRGSGATSGAGPTGRGSGSGSLGSGSSAPSEPAGTTASASPGRSDGVGSSGSSDVSGSGGRSDGGGSGGGSDVSGSDGTLDGDGSVGPSDVSGSVGHSDGGGSGSAGSASATEQPPSTEPECRRDGDCPIMGRPSCDGLYVVSSRPVCTAGVCSLGTRRELCENGCLDPERGGPGPVAECAFEIACPDTMCEGEPGPPRCEGNGWRTPVWIADPEDCAVCIEVDQEWPCASDEVCNPDLGCVPPGDCAPCPVFDPPPPVCDGDVVVEVTGIVLDPATCACEESAVRTDCALQDLTCADGRCVEED